MERSGNKPVVLQVVGEKDSGHPAPAALALQAIAVGESLAQRRREISQGTTFNGGMVEFVPVWLAVLARLTGMGWPWDHNC